MWLYLFSVCSHWSNGTFPMTHCFPKFATCCCQAREALTWMAVAVNEWDFFPPFQSFRLNPLADGSSNAVQLRTLLRAVKKNPNLNRPHLLQSYVDLCECKICWAALCLLTSHPLRTTLGPGKRPVRCALLAILDTSNAKLFQQQEKQWLRTALTSLWGCTVQFCLVFSFPKADSSARFKSE